MFRRFKKNTCFDLDISRTDLVDFPFVGDESVNPPLKEKVLDWLSQNSIKDFRTFWKYDTYPTTKMYIRFKNKGDALAFKMVWL